MNMLLSEMGCKVRSPIVIHSDSQSAISITTHNSDHARMKHIKIKNHYARLSIMKGTVILKWVRSEENIADIFTKTVTPNTFLNHRRQLVSEFSESQ